MNIYEYIHALRGSAVVIMASSSPVYVQYLRPVNEPNTKALISN